MYLFNENYVLPISHDEVVHGKKSLINKMFGDYDQKFSLMRAFLTYMMTLPGKKMTFMGTEFAQFREWDYENQLEWFMLKYPRHSEMQEFVSTLNNFYLQNKSLWEIDDSWDGYEWIDANQRDINVIAYKRKGINSEDNLIVVINFSPVLRENYYLTVDEPGLYEEVLSSDEICFGGSGILNHKKIKSKKQDGYQGTVKNHIEINIPPLSGVIIRKVSD
jgi:1,4-alpha-glucan branching enzyme